MYRLVCKIDSYNRVTGKANWRVTGSYPIVEAIGKYVSPAFIKTITMNNLLYLTCDKPYPIGSYINPRKALGI
jgi:hypothetical protein